MKPPGSADRKALCVVSTLCTWKLNGPDPEDRPVPATSPSRRARVIAFGDLRLRIVRENGNSIREAACRFAVSPSAAIRL